MHALHLVTQVLHKKCLVRLIHSKYLNILDVGVMQAVESVQMFPVNVLAKFPLGNALELQEGLGLVDVMTQSPMVKMCQPQHYLEPSLHEADIFLAYSFSVK